MEEVLKKITSSGPETDETIAQHLKCEEMREVAMEKCPKVTFLVRAMERMGCKIKDIPDFFSSEHCNGNINGGFRLNDKGKPGVVLCQNHILDQEWMNRTLAHELIHAFDHCRAKIDWRTDCDSHACSEVRAAALSGDCDFALELARGNVNIAKQHQICARRRAELSLQHNPMCEGKVKACVDRVFDTCYKDLHPYPEIPK
ncbi:unnamed protein product [Aphanomyces euteiches]|uniref:Mitochondrial inner membrane protease ATP23 n=1 Tax=Aphanomyces euteiches TaxID=100861 RepID=A0A6G0XKE6_9STRA|nr:hypothetical protein Ae201684_003760 [Aphanomyces euteiches]KAH9084496.1 hypothetical protein Ae201684P_001738 [Aphanomyces euteiches]KAH9140779.1 hypothetical protein AeRB84_015015 [Aphanomyces euteiches]